MGPTGGPFLFAIRLMFRYFLSVLSKCLHWHGGNQGVYLGQKRYSPRLSQRIQPEAFCQLSDMAVNAVAQAQAQRILSAIYDGQVQGRE